MKCAVLQKYIPFPARLKDIYLFNVLIMFSHANRTMSVPKICDVCHMHMIVNQLQLCTFWPPIFKTTVYVLKRRAASTSCYSWRQSITTSGMHCARCRRVGATNSKRSTSSKPLKYLLIARKTARVRSTHKPSRCLFGVVHALRAYLTNVSIFIASSLYTQPSPHLL